MEHIQLDQKTGKFIIGPKFEGHIGKAALAGLKKYGKKTIQIECISGKEETCESVRLRAIRVALTMRSRGFKVGDVTVVVAVNHLDSCIPFIASQCTGMTPVCLSVSMTHDEFRYMLGKAKPRVVFADPGVIPRIKATLAECGLKPEIVAYGHHEGCTPFEEFLKPFPDEDQFQCTDFDTKKTLALGACSGGTTGYPKLIGSTHFAALQRLFLKVASSAWQVEDFKAQVIMSPLHWAIGFVSVMTSCLFGQCRILSTVPFTPDLLMSAVEKYKPETALLTPVLVNCLVKSPNKRLLPTLRSIRLIGGPLEPQIMDQMDALLPNGRSFIRYGCTEMALISTCSNEVRGSVGKTKPWIQWKIVDEDTEEELGPNQPGELRMKSRTMFEWYISDPELTKAALDQNGFYKTGDLVHCDEEGNLFVVDRIKEMIKYKNYQVSPTELENLICTLYGVLIVGVVGLASEDGELPMAFVEKMPGTKICEKDIEDYVKHRLADHKQLRGGVVFMEKIPLTYSGKINRKVLKEHALQIAKERKN